MPRAHRSPYWRTQPNAKRRGERQLERAAQREVIQQIERTIGVHPKYRNGKDRQLDSKAWEAMYKKLLIEVSNAFVNQQRKG